MDQVVHKTLNEYFSQFKSIRYERGEIILRQNDTPQGIELIRSGYVRMYRIFDDGSELTVNIFKKGSFFPMVWAICDVPNLFYFQTMSATTTWRGPKESVVAFVKQNPAVLFELTKRLLSGHYGLLLHTEKLLIGSAEQKVISVLCMLDKRFGKHITENSKIITLRFSHQDVADYAHLSRETTSIQMKKLKDERVISYSGSQIMINDCIELHCRLMNVE